MGVSGSARTSPSQGATDRFGESCQSAAALLGGGGGLGAGTSCTAGLAGCLVKSQIQRNAKRQTGLWAPSQTRKDVRGAAAAPEPATAPGCGRETGCLALVRFILINIFLFWD